MEAPGRTSLWQDLAQVRRFPCLPGAVQVDVAVIGGGIRGLTCAILLAEAGARVVVVEAGCIGQGSTSRGTGAVTAQHGLCYADLVASNGVEAAAAWGRANLDAVDLVRDMVRRHDIDAGLETTDSVIHAQRPGDRAALWREMAALQELGLPASWEDDPALPWPSLGAIRFTGQACIQPVAHLAGLADALDHMGAAVFEGTRGLGVEREGTRHRVVTDRGPILAEHVVQAAPLPYRRGFQRAGGPARHALAARVVDPPADMLLTAGGPTRSVRTHRDGSGTWVVVVGDPHPADGRQRLAAGEDQLTAFAADVLGAGPITHRWAAHDLQPVDRLPLLHEEHEPRVHVPGGSGGLGLAEGVAAATLVVDRILGRGSPEAELLGCHGRTRRASIVRRHVDTHQPTPPVPSDRPHSVVLPDVRYTTDPVTIRSWAARHRLVPAMAVGDAVEPTLLPQDEAEVGRLDWDEWVGHLEQADLALLYEDGSTADLAVFRLVPREDRPT